MKWGRSIFPTSILEIGSKKDVKKKEKDFHLEKTDESTQDMDEGKPAKRRKTSEGKKAKGKRCHSFVSQSHTHQAQPQISNATRLHLQMQLFLASPLIPAHGIQQDSAASDLMEEVLEKVETLQMVLQSVESFVSE